MEPDTIIGCLIVIGAILALAGLVRYSRRRIDEINDRGTGTAREILKDTNGSN